MSPTTTRNVEALNGVVGQTAGGHHVYGLTHANPYVQLTVVPRAIAIGDGRFCAMPDISLALGFSEFVVYLARELTDECRRSVIREHEQEHVNTWRSHLRASAQMLTTILRRDVGEPRVYASREELQAGVRAWGSELVTPWAKRILDGVVEAQKAIDTPASYAGVVSRLRACPRRAGPRSVNARRSRVHYT